MPQFAFTAKDRMGNTVQGKMDAVDAAFAANQVGQMGYALIDLRPDAPSTESTIAFHPGSPAEPTSAFVPPSSPDASGRTQAIPASSPPGSARPPVPAGASPPPAMEADLMRVDAEKRRKVEMDLGRMGMKPDEIKRLLDANPNTTAPPAGSATALPSSTSLPAMPGPMPPPAKGKGAQQKLAARAADLHSFAAQLQSSSAAVRVQAIEAVTLDLPDFRTSTPEERRQAESLLREVYALRRREKFAEALAKCREALGLVPSDAAALEMFGDLLQGVARTNEALASYRRATEADPKRASAERKYGDLLMRQQQWNEVDTEEVPRNPIAAAALSLLVPGAGQLHNGERLKGAILLAFAVACVAAVLFLTRDKLGYQATREKPGGTPVAAVREKRVAIDWMAESPLIACILFYGVLGIGSAIDAAAVAYRTRQGR